MLEFTRRLEYKQSKSGDPRGLILDKSHSSTVSWRGKKRQREKVDLIAPQRPDGN